MESSAIQSKVLPAAGSLSSPSPALGPKDDIAFSPCPAEEVTTLASRKFCQITPQQALQIALNCRDAKKIYRLLLVGIVVPADSAQTLQMAYIAIDQLHTDLLEWLAGEGYLSQLSLKEAQAQLDVADAPKGSNLLHGAASLGAVVACKELLALGMDKFRLTANRFSPFLYANRLPHTDAKRRILAFLAPSPEEAIASAQALKKALVEGDRECVYSLVVKGCLRFEDNEKGRLRLLEWSIVRGDISLQWAVIRSFIPAGDEVLAHQANPLHVLLLQACHYGNFSVAIGLLSLGASALVKRGSQPSPLAKAVQMGADSFALQMVAIQMGRQNGVHCLSQLLQNGEKEAAKWLFEHGALNRATTEMLTARSVDGHTLLHFAVLHGIEELVAGCLEKGAPINATDHWMQTPLHLACALGNGQIVALLLKNADVSVDVYDRFDQTPLMRAVMADSKMALSSGLYDCTLKEQTARLLETKRQKPFFRITRARNLSKSLWLPVRRSRSLVVDQAQKAFGEYREALTKAVAVYGDSPQTERLKAVARPAAMRAIWESLCHPGGPLPSEMATQFHHTRCGNTTWVVSTTLTGNADSMPLCGINQIGSARFRWLLHQSDCPVYRCTTWVEHRATGRRHGDHEFIFEKVDDGQYRIHQSYLKTYTYEQQLLQTAYGSVAAGDLSNADLEVFLRGIERLGKENWGTLQRRLYRDLFHATSPCPGRRMIFTFLPAIPETALMLAAEAGDHDAVRDFLATENSAVIAITDSRENTVLHRLGDDPKMIKILLADVRVRHLLVKTNHAAHTPLTRAIAKGYRSAALALSSY